MPCKYQWAQINNVTAALRELAPTSAVSRLAGFSDLLSIRSSLLQQVIGPFPRLNVLFTFITGLSPGSVRVWFDTENGWFAEGRAEPGAPPAYHKISAAEARALLQEKPDPDLAHRMMQPDTYAGE